MPRNMFGCPSSSEEAFNRRRVSLGPPTDEIPEDLLEQCGVWVRNQKGLKGSDDAALGQDNFCIALLDGGWELYGVFDGHGTEGHWPAQRAAQSLPAFLQSGDCAAMMRQGRIDAALIRAFDQVQQDMEHAAWPSSRSDPHCDLRFCGCTGICVLRHPSQSSLWVANVGDSRAVLLAPGRGVLRETSDHKPSVASERQRVEECGCEMREQVFDDGLVEQRVFIKGKMYPGIMMTRSLGDLVVKEKGIIATPEVVEWTLDSCQGAVLVVASDGIWDFSESEEVGEAVLQERKAGRSLGQIGRDLVALAQELWEAKEPGYCDDITLLMLSLDGPGLRPVRRNGKSSKSETCCASGCAVQ
uniref:PPM-type phosphatase domain-containing protein n=1 Tax=Alexandrium catenella TaxID=2925 RepID=A0A7S1SDG9_ALECA